MTEWQRKALALYQSGYSKTGIARKLQNEMGAPTVERARDRVRYFLKTTPEVNREYKPAVKTAKRPKYEALENLTPTRHTLVWDGGKVIRFGLLQEEMAPTASGGGMSDG